MPASRATTPSPAWSPPPRKPSLPVAFTRLRIAGFKSFAEPQTVEILPGLTGVVGPNGCGKSNVVEALRWAMGETSARSLRGGEMDDVIFAGSIGRPSRNLAEVVVTLEEAVGTAPPPFHEAPELQISRKIERGAGSTFRVNGREARARDVQTLFADLASGARSSAMVSQGRVGTIINARPDERRLVLEEAAGITGLHARRHEAELKLRAAEANLERAQDLRTQLEGQLAALQKQARQALRWRTLSTTVKEAEAELLAIARSRVEAEREAAATAAAAARATLASAGQAAADAGRAEAETATALPPLREAEATARTALERLRVVREQMAAEVARARDALAAATARQAQVARDLAHAERTRAEADAAASRLAAERDRLRAAEAEAPARLAAAQTELAAASDAAREAETAANRATERAAELTATSQSLTQALAQAEARAKRLAGQSAQLRADRDRAAAARIDPAALANLAAAAAQSAADAAASRHAQEAAEQARAAAAAAASAARQRDATDAAALAKLTAQTAALAEVLGVKDGERWPPMVDALSVPAGLEAALGAALGEELGAAADPAAARHWRELPPLAAPILPAEALSSLVSAPPTLQRALCGIGLVESEAEGDAKQPHLLAGQALVSRAGGVWRWDGYTVRAGTPTPAAIRLQQRNRLNALRADLAQAREAAAQSAAVRAAADAADRDAAAADAAARATRRDAEARAATQHSEHARLATRAEQADAQLAALEAQLGRLHPEAEDAAAALAALQAERARLPDLTVLRAAVDRARSALAAARARDAAAQAAQRDAERDAGARRSRLQTLEADLANQALRSADASGRETDLRARAAEASAEAAALGNAPAAIAEQAAEATAALAAAEAEHRRVAAAVEAASRASTQAAAAARAAEAAQAQAREDLVRAEAAAAQDGGRTHPRAARRQRGAPPCPGRPLRSGRRARPPQARPPRPRARGYRPGEPARGGRGGGDGGAHRRHGGGKGRAEHRHRQAARLHRPHQPRGPRAARPGVRRGGPPLPGAVRPHVRRRPGPPGAGWLRRPAGGRARNLRPTPGQEAGHSLAALRRRAGPDRAVPDLRRVPLQPGADLRARRGGRPARRRQRGAFLHPAGRDGARDRHALPGGHAPPPDDGADGPAVWRDDAGARRVAAAVGRPGARGGDGGPARGRGIAVAACEHGLRAGAVGIGKAMSPTRPVPAFISYAIALGIGLCFVFWLVAPDVMVPLHPLHAAAVEDRAQSIIGQRYFLRDAWRWPLLHVAQLDWPTGLSIGLTDSIPIIMLPLKLVRAWLPPGFYVQDGWLAIAWAVQPAAAVFALRSMGERRLVAALCVGVLSLSLPSLLVRDGQMSLCTHALILWAIGLYFRGVQAPTAVRGMA